MLDGSDFTGLRCFAARSALIRPLNDRLRAMDYGLDTPVLDRHNRSE
jgi:hypothetical protein